MATTAKKIGRKAGGKNRGYFWRNGRGWYRSDRQALRDEFGNHLQDPKTPHSELKVWLLKSLSADHSAIVKAATQPTKVAHVSKPSGAALTVRDLVTKFLAAMKAKGAATASYDMRERYLFDFVTGLSGSARKHPDLTTAQREKYRLHDGFGDLPVADVIAGHAEEWLAAHPDWKASRRMAVMSLKHPFHWASTMGYIPASPLRGLKDGKAPARLTYITPEQEAALLRHSSERFATALAVCIRCGFRPGQEFARITAENVEQSERGLVVTFKNHKTAKQTGRSRVVYISRATAPEIVEIFERAIEDHPTGALFRNRVGEPWTQVALQHAFGRARKRSEAEGLKFDSDACMYSTRHTFAKRVLNGFWGGKGCTIELLAKLMGNSPQIARKYADWCEGYVEPLWAAV